ncbi:MAG: DUF4825 domain-containing protein [Bacillota bacterium]
MKLFNAIILLTITTILFITGCSNENEVKIKSIDDVDVESLKEYSGTYVGDNSNVITIISKLAGGETFKHIDLSGEMIKATYGFNEGSLSEDEILSYWVDGTKVDRKNFYFNAIYLTILVPNAKEYHFKVDNSMVSVSRERMVEVLSEKLSDFPNEENIWDEKIVSGFLDKNLGEIKELAKNYQQFFE